MILSLIAAASENNVIGRDNDLPWNLPDDLRFFRRITSGHPVIMGRRNFESIVDRLGKPLPGRLNIVITRRPEFAYEGVAVAHSLEEAIDLARQAENAQEVFIIGGGQIYEQSLPLAQRLYLTRIHADIEGDIFFPNLDENEWEEVGREYHASDEEHLYAFTFLTYDRKG